MIKPTYRTERKLLAEGYQFIIGCDEVGRACLAGPVVAGAVILDPVAVAAGKFKAVRDSKLLSASQREALEPLIIKHSLAWGIGVVSWSAIDKINIHHASLLAMNRAVNKIIVQMKSSAKIITLIDGKFSIPKLDIDQQAIIGGDSKILSISAASVIAKVFRDRLMTKYSDQFPEYGFQQHKGYPTLQHRLAIQKFGPISIHRVSFLK